MQKLATTVGQLAQKIPELETSIFFTATDSTNREAQKAAKENPNLKYGLFVAEQQSHGKGRGERTWESPPKHGLYFSLLIRPSLSPSDANLLTLASGLALKKVLQQKNIDCLLKWPNDLLVKQKKVAGILCEMECLGNQVDNVVIGVGINVSQQQSDFSPELQSIAGSLQSTTQQPFSREELLTLSTLAILQEVRNLIENGNKALIEGWQRDSGFIGKKICIEIDGKEASGIVKGLNANGHLQLKQNNGETIEIMSGDAFLIKSNE